MSEEITHYEKEVEIMGRLVTIQYDDHAYITPANYRGHPDTWYPAEVDGEYENVVVSWGNDFGTNYHEIEEDDKDWHRLKRLCPKFIKEINNNIGGD